MLHHPSHETYARAKIIHLSKIAESAARGIVVCRVRTLLQNQNSSRSLDSRLQIFRPKTEISVGSVPAKATLIET